MTERTTGPTELVLFVSDWLRRVLKLVMRTVCVAFGPVRINQGRFSQDHLA